MGGVEVEREGASKEWEEQRKGGRKKGRQSGEERGGVEGGEDEMVKGKEGWSGRKLGIGRREGERWRGKGLREEQNEGDKTLHCV